MSDDRMSRAEIEAAAEHARKFIREATRWDRPDPYAVQAYRRKRPSRPGSVRRATHRTT